MIGSTDVIAQVTVLDEITGSDGYAEIHSGDPTPVSVSGTEHRNGHAEESRSSTGFHN